MKRKLTLFVPILMLAVALPAIAGDKHCTAGTQECLDYMAANLKEKGWVGIELDEVDGQLIVNKVVADSPAEKAGLEKGDVLVALNGVAYAEDNREEMGKLQKQMKPGKEFTFTVSRKHHDKDVAITLGTLPDDVLAQWVGNHMMEHASATNAEEE